jgi:hypothetical protein
MLTIPTTTVITTLTTPTTIIIITIITGTTGISAQFFQHCIAVATSDCGASDKAGPAVRHISRDLRASLRVREHNHANTPVPRQSSI